VAWGGVGRCEQVSHERVDRLLVPLSSVRTLEGVRNGLVVRGLDCNEWRQT
jgi:hypothetical protein